MATLWIGLFPGAVSACRLALALALDVSSSVDAEEYALQRDGLAAALVAPEVRDAFLGPGGSVALAVYEWSGGHHQTLTLDWTIISDLPSLERAAAHIGGAQRSSKGFPTGIGRALGYGGILLKSAPSCERHVIDMSGDGIHNDGFPPASAYRHFPLDRVTVNGLVIQRLGKTAESQTLGIDVIGYYLREVIKGAGAFVIVADGFEDFERAMREKLVREAASFAVGQSEITP